MDMNDRALRQIATGLGGRESGPARETGFVITAASEIMAILALAESRDDLRAPARPHRRRLHATTDAGDRRRTQGRRPDDGAVERCDPAQPGADHGGRAGDRALRPVRQHRPRHQQRAGAAHRPAPVRLRRQRNRLCGGPWRREVLRSRDADVRARAVGGRGHRHVEGVARAGRITGWSGRGRVPEPGSASRQPQAVGRPRGDRAESFPGRRRRRSRSRAGLLPIDRCRRGIERGLRQGWRRHDGAGGKDRGGGGHRPIRRR